MKMQWMKTRRPIPEPTWAGTAGAIKMSQEDISVGAPAEEPHIPPIGQQRTPIEENTHLYTQLPLPPLPTTHIRILFNNTNGLKTDDPGLLTPTLESYLTYKPTILGIIKTQRNWQNYEKTTAPLRTTLNRLQGTRNTKVTTSHCQDDHTAKDIHQRGGVAQITLKPIQNRINNSGSDELG